MVGLNIDEGEADPVDGDGAFGDAQAHDFGRGCDADFPGAVLPVGAEESAGGIDVAGNEVASESGGEREGAFEVESVADTACAESGFGHGFGAGEGGEAGGGEFLGGEADAINGDGIPAACVLANLLAGYFEANALAERFDSAEGAQLFDNAREHGWRIPFPFASPPTVAYPLAG